VNPWNTVGFARGPKWFPVVFVTTIVVQLALAGGLIAAGWRQAGRFPGLPSTYGTVAAGPDAAVKPAIERLLSRRSAAVLAQDRDAFLRTVDPRSSRFAVAQDRFFQRVSDVPFSDWRYRVVGGLSPRVRSASVAGLRRRYHAPVWLAKVVVSQSFRGAPGAQLSGIDYLTFVHREHGWYLGGDDDLAEFGLHTSRQPWDFGPVVTVTLPHVVVLGHVVQQDYVDGLADLAERSADTVEQLFHQMPPRMFLRSRCRKSTIE